MQATKQDVQIINGIEYPYVTSDGNPARILCENRVSNAHPVAILVLTEIGETYYCLTWDHRLYGSDIEPCIKPYVKPSIFEDMKPGTVVFVRETSWSNIWQPVCFDKETGNVVVSGTGYKYDKSRFEFRLDNPYLAAPEQPAEKPWIEWKVVKCQFQKVLKLMQSTGTVQLNIAFQRGIQKLV